MEIEPFFFRDAVRHFWDTRGRQASDQSRRGASDQGRRGAVTGGRHLDGFVVAIASLLMARGVRRSDIYFNGAGPPGPSNKTELPGYFRTSKRWDMLVMTDGLLRAIVEFKAQVGSFGNNFNNRAEEALGSAADFWTAFREGQLAPSPQPWLGYFFVLSDEELSRRSGTRVATPHFPVRPEFAGASYVRRVELLCRRLVLERQYSSACFLLTDPGRADADENYTQPAADLGAEQFLNDLVRHTSDP
jgi:hypothetical protein